MQHFQVIKDNWNELDVPFSLVSENKRRVEVRSGAEVQYFYEVELGLTKG